jgi:hypothetical protein
MMNYMGRNPLSIGMGYQSPFQSNTTSNPLAIGMGASPYQGFQQPLLTGSTDLMATVPTLSTNTGSGFQWFDTKDQQGIASPLIGAIGTGANVFMGMKQIGMAKDQLAFQKNSWQEQFNMQKSEFDYARKRRDERRASYDIMKARV